MDVCEEFEYALSDALRVYDRWYGVRPLAIDFFWELLYRANLKGRVFKASGRRVVRNKNAIDVFVGEIGVKGKRYFVRVDVKSERGGLRSAEIMECWEI